MRLKQGPKIRQRFHKMKQIKAIHKKFLKGTQALYVYMLISFKYLL